MASTMADGQAGRAGTTPAAVQVVTPVFHQLVAYSLPTTFTLNEPEHSNAKSYLHETVLRGETLERWTQMITLTGENGLTEGGVTAQRMFDTMAEGIKRGCPETFASESIGDTTVSAQKAYVGMVSCGKVQDTGGEAHSSHSETALIVAIAGSHDMYTVQWAERGPAVGHPMAFDDVKWVARFHTLRPLRVCARVEGEAAPYPSCMGK